MMSKKGISGVVSTVLIILLVVAAIAIIGVIVLNTTNRASSNVESAQLCQQILFTPTKCSLTSDIPFDINVDINRGNDAQDVQISSVSAIFKYPNNDGVT